MNEHDRITKAQLAMLSDTDLRTLRGYTRRLADETQRQAANYQRSTCAINREIKRRAKAARGA
jgi:hypothetical protein